MKPLISVILPVYNGGEYLKLSVESVLKQDLSDFEFLILDDGSTDGSREWLSGLTDKRVQFFKNEINRGLFYNLNFLAEKCNSEIIKLWAQDDIMFPHCLKEVVKFHLIHPEIGFSYSMREMIDEHGNIRVVNGNDITPEIVSSSLHAKIAYYTGSIAGNIANTAINIAALQKVGKFDESMKISADFDMWVRLAEYFPVGHIRQKLIYLRDHNGQLSRTESLYINHVKEDLKVYRKLDKYVDPEVKKNGLKLYRYNKQVFYYNLMFKSLIHGKIPLFLSYFSALKNYDSIMKGLIAFFQVKLVKKKVRLFEE